MKGEVSAGDGAERSEAEAPADERRGRPGRRSVGERASGPTGSTLRGAPKHGGEVAAGRPGGDVAGSSARNRQEPRGAAAGEEAQGGGAGVHGRGHQEGTAGALPCRAPYGAREVVQVSRDTTYGRATVKQVCAAFGISRQAYYQAQKGSTAVKRTPRREREGPWATAAELEEKVRECAGAHPAWGVRKIHASCAVKGWWPPASGCGRS